MAVDLTVVVPAYNEARRLGPSLASILDYLEGRGLSHQVLVVDDGSADDTAGVARGFADRGVELISLERNRGKGAALRRGVLASRGARLLLTDADLSTPITELEKLEPHLESGAGMVLGSRAAAGAQVRVHQPAYRELMGKTFNLLIRLLGVRGLRDTQCGFKLLCGELARELFADLTVDGFAFDVELVWLAQARGHRVVEVGVVWVNSPASTVHPVFDSAAMLRDVVRMRWRHRGGAKG